AAEAQSAKKVAGSPNQGAGGLVGGLTSRSSPSREAVAPNDREKAENANPGPMDALKSGKRNAAGLENPRPEALPAMPAEKALSRSESQGSNHWEQQGSASSGQPSISSGRAISLSGSLSAGANTASSPPASNSSAANRQFSLAPENEAQSS